MRLHAIFISLVLAAAGTASAVSSHLSNETDCCHVKEYAGIPAAVADCKSIILDSITVPGRSSIDLSELQHGAKVTFRGTTSFEYAEANWIFIKVGGCDIEITADIGAVINGNGSMWWDGKGGNGGIVKPNVLMQLDKVIGKSSVHHLYIENFAVRAVSIQNSSGVDVHHLTLNNSAGSAPNSRSNGSAAAHNTDGFGVKSSTNIRIRDTSVINQDDCVAVTSGHKIMVKNMYCDGGHGFSIGSVGGKSDNNVTNVKFSNSAIFNSQNAVRIKTNSNTTGFVSGITFENIRVENITRAGINIQQDYLNGGPTGIPTNGVIIQNVNIKNIHGTATPHGRNYFILCGDGSCRNIKIDNVSITGGGLPDICNFETKGNFDCDGKFAKGNAAGNGTSKIER